MSFPFSWPRGTVLVASYGHSHEGIMWTPVEIDGKTYCIYNNIDSSNVIVYVTDMVSLWVENLNESLIQLRFKECNPLINATLNKCIEYVKNFLNFSSPDVQREFSHSGNIFTMKTSQKKSMLRFSFYFKMEKESPNMFYKEVTLPLLLLVKELGFRQEALYKALEAKDKEILEYKLEGATISRKNIETKPFEISTFESECQEELEARAELSFKNPGLVLPEFIGDIHKKLKSLARNGKKETREEKSFATSSRSVDDIPQPTPQVSEPEVEEEKQTERLPMKCNVKMYEEQYTCKRIKKGKKIIL